MGKRRKKRRQMQQVQRYITVKADPPKKVFQIKSAHFWAGAGSEVKAQKWAALLCCAGNGYVPYSDDAAAITLSLHWDDGHVPPVSKVGWEEIVRLLSMVNGDVGVYCVGGHGRTGTALSIIAGLAGLTTTDPVAFIRSIYDDRAVETKTQIEYVEKITGIKVEAEASGIDWDWLDYRSLPFARYIVPKPQLPNSTTATSPQLPFSGTKRPMIAIRNAAGDIMYYREAAPNETEETANRDENHIWRVVYHSATRVISWYRASKHMPTEQEVEEQLWNDHKELYEEAKGDWFNIYEVQYPDTATG